MLSVSPSCWAYALGRSPSFGPCLSPAKHAISKRFVVSFGRVAGGFRRRSRAGGHSTVVASLLVCRSLLAPRALRSSLPSSASHRRFGRVVTREGRSARGWSCDARRGAWGVRAARLSASPSPRLALVMRTLAGARRNEGAVRVMRRTKRRRETTAERPPRAANAAVNSPRARAESARRVRVEPERRALSSASDLALFFFVLVPFPIPRAL